MRENHRPSDTKQPLALGSFRNWLRLLWGNRGVDRRFLRRAAFVSSVSLLTIPLRAYERMAYRRSLRRLSLEESPIFIIGHWRSGTTPLHQLLCRDSAMGFVSTFQAIAPDWFLTGTRCAKSLLARAVPRKRMMDNMSLSLDDPQEEEFAVAETSPYSFYHQWSFPRNARTYFEKYVLFHGVSSDVVDDWKKTYLSILRKAQYGQAHKRLVLKNPLNTARIAVLLEMFPKARFINIYRNPFVVFQSSRHFFKSVLAITQLQEIDDEEIQSNIFWFYEQLMQRYFAERHLIPPGQLSEIRFEDFEKDPLIELGRVYEELGLAGFESAGEAFRSHLRIVNGYQKNHYVMDEQTMESVRKHWGFTVDRLGYCPRRHSLGDAPERDAP